MNASKSKEETHFEKEAGSIECGPCRIIQDNHIVELTSWDSGWRGLLNESRAGVLVECGDRINGKSKICPTAETVNYLVTFLYVHVFKHIFSRLWL